jgi:hypothetical protein
VIQSNRNFKLTIWWFSWNFVEIENKLEEVSEIEPSARVTSSALSVFVEISLSLSAFQ